MGTVVGHMILLLLQLLQLHRLLSKVELPKLPLRADNGFNILL
jgi:hypothetical protein